MLESYFHMAKSIAELQEIAKRVRRDIIEMITAAKSGHPGGSLSAVELVVELYFDHMRIDPANPKWADRDRFILSKGHAAPVLYSVMAERGYADTPKDKLNTLRKFGSVFQGHPDMRFIPSLEASTGSLGQGLSLGLGMALAARLNGSPSRTYVMLGDGEIQEGQIWEAAMFGAFHKVDNLVAIVDNNRIQLDGFVEGHHGGRAAGRQVAGVRLAHAGDRRPRVWKQSRARFAEAAATKGKPTCLVAHTIKGKGVSFMENNPKFHGVAPTQDELKLALQELQLTMPAETKPKFELKLGAATREAFGRDAGGTGAREQRRRGGGRRPFEVHHDHVFRQGISRPLLLVRHRRSEHGGRRRRPGHGGQDSVRRQLLRVRDEQGLRAAARRRGLSGRSNLKVVGTHSGISIGEDGPSQMSIEEIGLACSLAGFVVIAPADEVVHQGAGARRGGARSARCSSAPGGPRRR